MRLTHVAAMEENKNGNKYGTLADHVQRSDRGAARENEVKHRQAPGKHNEQQEHISD